MKYCSAFGRLMTASRPLLICPIVALHPAGALAAVFVVFVSIIQRLSITCEVYNDAFDAIQFDIKPVNRHCIALFLVFLNHTPACANVRKRHTVT
jgi:hypothetical protein